MVAANKKPAGKGGLSEGHDESSNQNIDKLSENVKVSVPAWMLARVAQIAIERKRVMGCTLEKAVQDLEFEGTATLAAELVINPSLAEGISPDFIRLVRAGSIGGFQDHERAAIVILADAARTVMPAIDLDRDMAEFIRLKWEALGELLGGRDE